MSEYQYYGFATVDRPLAARELDALFRPGPVTALSSGPDEVRFFRTLFAARTDVYAIR